jgi:hypothetical protein
LNEIAEKAEKLSYPRSDNISALAMRFISAEGEQLISDEARENQVTQGGHDSLEDAIAQIEEVIREYESEIKP